MYLLLADVVDLDIPAIELRDFEEELPVFALRETQRRLGHHVDGLQACLTLVLSRADVYTNAASRAVFRRDLDRVLQALPFLIACNGGLKSGRSSFQVSVVVNLDSDDGMRTDHGALTTLDTSLRIPDGNLERNVAFFPPGSAGRECADLEAQRRCILLP